MTEKQVTFELAPIYKKLNVDFHQAKACRSTPRAAPTPMQTLRDRRVHRPARAGETAPTSAFDYLINATGPKLNFGATPGLGPDEGYTTSVCTPSMRCTPTSNCRRHRRHEAGRDQDLRRRHRPWHVHLPGRRLRVHLQRRPHPARGRRARQGALVWISNEYELGDFGMGGVHIKRGGYITNGKVFAESLMVERGIGVDRARGGQAVEPGKIHYEILDGSEHELDFDFAMLIPPFAGQPMKAFDKAGEDITAEIFAPNGFMKVDADYTPKPYEEWSKADWPQHLPDAQVQEHLRHRHRLRAAAPDQQADAERQRHADQPRAAAHRHAVGRHRQGGRREHPRHARRRPGAHAYRQHGRDGRRLPVPPPARTSSRARRPP
jgi:sulfide:quinone oxidoreductase